MNWTMAPLGEVTQVLSGTTPDSGNPALWGGAHVWVTPTDLGKLDGLIISESARHISDLALRERSLPLIPKNAVVMSSRAPIGHLALAGCDLYTNQGCKSFVCGEDLDPDFLFFNLRHRMGDIQALGSGSTFMEVSKSALEGFEIWFPHIDEQRQIAARLKAQLAEVETARQAAQVQLREAALLRQRLLSVTFISICEVPKVAIKEIANIQLGKMLSPKAKTGKESFLYLRNQNVQWGYFDLSDMTKMDFDAHERDKFSLRKGDLLICEGGEPGRCAVWNEEIENCFYQKALHRLRPYTGVADAEFLAYWLRFQADVGAFSDQNAKTTIAHLPLTRLEQLPVPAIDIDDQRRIVTRLKAQLAEADALRTALEQQLSDLDALPQRILAQAFEN